MQIFKRVDSQTGECRQGTWDEICDLDKRIWSEPEEIISDPDLPLATVPCVRIFTCAFPWPPITYMGKLPIYSLHDLTGVHI